MRAPHNSFSPIGAGQTEILRVEDCERQAFSLYQEAVAAIESRRDAALVDLGLGGEPVIIRVRAAIRATANDAKHVASALLTVTTGELLTAGEISDASDETWTRLIDPESAARLFECPGRDVYRQPFPLS